MKNNNEKNEAHFTFYRSKRGYSFLFNTPTIGGGGFAGDDLEEASNQVLQLLETSPAEHIYLKGKTIDDRDFLLGRMTVHSIELSVIERIVYTNKPQLQITIQAQEE